MLAPALEVLPRPGEATTVARRIGTRAAETREAILDATVQVLLLEGMHSAKITDIARRADVSLGLLNYHFDNRQSLLRAGLVAALERIASETFDSDDPLRIASVAMTDPRWMQLRTHALRESVFDDEVRQALTEATVAWEMAVGSHAGVSSVTVTVLTSLADGLRQRMVTGIMERAEAETLFDATAEMLGVTPHPGSRRDTDD